MDCFHLTRLGLLLAGILYTAPALAIWEPPPAYTERLDATYPYLCEYASASGSTVAVDASLYFNSSSGAYGFQGSSAGLSLSYVIETTLALPESFYSELQAQAHESIQLALSADFLIDPTGDAVRYSAETAPVMLSALLAGENEPNVGELAATGSTTSL